MATYKKRGHKPQNKEDYKKDLESKSTTAEVFNTLDESASKTEKWVAANQKWIVGTILGITLLVLAYMGYDKYIKQPTAKESMNDMFLAQSYFEKADANIIEKEKDSLFQLSLHGAEGKYGMLDIVEEYSGTDASNLASYYAGMAYLNLKDYKNAISYLEKFESRGEVLGSMALGGIGDAFSQLEQFNDALDYYKKAAQETENEYTTPMFLMKASKMAIQLENYSDALDLLNQLNTQYKNPRNSNEVLSLMGFAEAKLK